MVLKAFDRFFVNPTFTAAENGTSGENPMATNKSSLKDFLASIATMSGDLSNITAPPFVLDQRSVVEIPAFWAENPEMFVSPAQSEDPAERALLILKSFLAGMKSQCYMGHTEEEGVKKPLNAFLGELFLGHWDTEESGTTFLCSEQVSHHPPITACRVWNPKHGVIAEGYNRQKVTFSWGSMSVHVSSTGYALKSVEKYDEHYMIPLPDFRVKGVLSGAPYPELEGEFFIPSTNGYMSKIDFSGKGMFGGGTKHAFHAVIYQEDEGPKHPIYTLHGTWNKEFTIHDNRTGKDIETYSVVNHVKTLPKLQVPPIEEMDPWETRRAWHDTKEAIGNNDFGATSAAKSFLEQGQRNMRKEEEKNGTTWQQVFFKSSNSHEIVAGLMAKVPGHESFAKTAESTKGVWKFDSEAWEKAEKPFHPGLEPDNLKEGEERVYRNGSRGSIQLSRDNTPRNSVDFRTPRGSVDLSNGYHYDSPRASIDSRRGGQHNDSPRASIDSRRGGQHNDSPRASIDSRRGSHVDERIGAVEYGRPAEVNGTKVDVGRQPDRREIKGITKNQPSPQTSQKRMKEEELGSGIEGINLKEKIVVEDMLRSATASNS